MMRPIDFGRRYVRINGPIKLRIDMKSLIITAILILLTIAVAIFALMTGTLKLSVQEVFSAFVGQASGMKRTVVMEWRLPRILAAIIFGAGLAVSGAIFQSITRNPLGSPDIIGFTSGSYTGALVAMLVSGATSYIGVATGALIGGFATAIIIYLLAFRKGTQGFRLIIVGIAISAVLGSVNSMLLLKSDAEVALTAAAWGVGSLNGIDWEQAILPIIVVIFLLICAWIMNRPLREMELGDDAAKSHGVRIGRDQLLLILIAVALTAAPTAVMGPISFVALVAPQIALRLTKSAESLFPIAAMGAFLLLGADVLAQRIISGNIFPVGVVTLSLGGIYLIYLLFHQARTTL
ncbi:iron chelate uptake ABC transporter family permease subunit [Bacillus sp. FJAT-50079]|uniref:FecCD family ABC transporter permease n=1 Tax=Bacillus sp. FJAT-50079 TaxID=2833577 RepID=UPI002015F17B|nr:iron chelate uptake ABC transporter family permease subunit [Bacillus sp. FJAT-50079]